VRTEVLIIGGGITGAGIARDLAMRGVQTILLEKGDFSAGTTGRCHGMLHSGGRYAVKDPASARECARECQIIRRIASFCVEGTGGLFVSLEGDDVEYIDHFLEGCRRTGVLAEPIDLREAIEREPNLSPDVRAAISVPDAYVDPFFLTHGNIESARANGAVARNYCQVLRMERAGERIEKVIYRDLRNGQEESVNPEIVVNATGAWAGEIASLAGLEIPVKMDKGTLVVMNGRLVNGLVNRLRRPSDGDIIVPSHSSSILGTTSVEVSSPRDNNPTTAEVELLIKEASQMVPLIADGRAIRAYAGIRPLPMEAAGGREISRTFRLIDHKEGGVENMISIIGGKLTTYRLMAEKVSDLVVSKLGMNAPCTTMKEEIRPPSPKALRKGTGGLSRFRMSRKYGALAASIARICDNTVRGRELVCSCEEVQRGELEFFSSLEDVKELSDLMRRTRAGMGYCQGGLCAYNMVSAMLDHSDEPPLKMLKNFRKERWKGIQPVLFGDQLRQEVFKLYFDTSLGISDGGETSEEN